MIREILPSEMGTEKYIAARRLFENNDDTLITAAFDGHGSVFALYNDNDSVHPLAVMTVSSCFFHCAGNPDASDEISELITRVPQNYTEHFRIFAAEPYGNDTENGWEKVIYSTFNDCNIMKRTRYAIKKERDVFNRQRLLEYINILPEDERPVMFTPSLFDNAGELQKVLFLFCNTADDYIKKSCGLGRFILRDGKIVSGATVFMMSSAGAEIEIDTASEYRRRGYALACASAFIIDCLDRNIYPSWDADNTASVALSEKLGYHFDKEYEIYQVSTKC